MKKEAGFAHILLFFLLITGLVVTVILVGQKTNFLPKASEKFLPRGSENTTQTVQVLELKYFPLDSSGTKIDATVTGTNEDLTSIRSWTTANTDQLAKNLTEGTKYHGYKDSNVEPALRYELLDSKEFLKATPIKYWPDINWHYYSDYQKMLTEDVDICDYVDNKGVKDVWIWSYQYGQNGIFESNMSMGKTSKSFWTDGTYGDISNDHFKLNNLPQCNKTYVVYNFNYHNSGGVTNMMEDYIHQIENELNYAGSPLFWDMYVGKKGDFAGPRRCGNAHTPPNLQGEYNYAVTTSVRSDCENWQPVNCTNISDVNADCGGSRAEVNCNNWGCNEIGYRVWWMQNIPGLNNNLTLNDQKLRNWWEFMGDFDMALSKSNLLFIPNPTPTPHLGITVSNETVNLNIAPGKKIKAFELTSTGATSYYIWLAINNMSMSNLGFNPDFGQITKGQTIGAYIIAGDALPFGVYNFIGSVASDLSFSNRLPEKRFPVTITVVDPDSFVCTPCAADVAKDLRNQVNALDRGLVSGCLGKTSQDSLTNGKSCAAADMNGDGVVNQEIEGACVQKVYYQACVLTLIPTATPTLRPTTPPTSTPTLTPTPTIRPTPTPFPFECTPCTADVNSDGVVNINDQARISYCFGRPAGVTASGVSCVKADIDKSGIVNSPDRDCVATQLNTQCSSITPTP